MKRTIYIFFAVIFIAGGCASTGKSDVSREEMTAARSAAVAKLVEDQKMLVKVNRLRTKRGRIMDMNPETNFLIIDKEKARISLGYLGRSYTTRSIAAINMEGRVVSRSISERKKGGYEIKYEVSQKNEKFKINMTVSTSGYVDFSIINPRIDLVRYSGNLKSY